MYSPSDEAVAVLVGLGQGGVDGGKQQVARRVGVAVAVEEEIGRGDRRVERLAERRIPAMRVAQELRRAVEIAGEAGAGVRRVGQPPAPIRSGSG